MKSYQLIDRLTRHFGRRLRHVMHTRRGTVIIIVLALLGMLALLGFFILSITGSEQQAATYFAGASKVNAAAAANADTFFDSILRQIIIGPATSEKQSALWGGNKSLLPTMFGRDMAVFNGPGVNLIWNSTLNQPTVDQTYDGLPDDGTGTQPDNRSLALLNFSPAAAVAWQPNTAYFAGAFVTPASGSTGLLYVATAAGTSGASQPAWPTSARSTVVDNGTLTWKAATSLDFNSFPIAGAQFPDPDTNITYPDITNAFLASDTLVPNGTASNPVRVITPSFHRPMLLRNLAPSAQWYTSPATAPYVLFPHVLHLAIDGNGNLTGTPRFVTNMSPDTVSTAGTWAATTAYTAGQMVNATPAGASSPSTYVCTVAGTSGGAAPTWPNATGTIVNDGTVVWTDNSLQPFPIPGDTGAQPPSEGVWTPTGIFNPASPPAISYAVDTDNDGVTDARYMDFSFPLMSTPDGSQQFVALGTVKIIDADSLFNLNTHGNRAGHADLPVANNFGNPGGFTPGVFISQSDYGISASEVNPEWALNARPLAGGLDFPGTAPALTAALQSYTLFFRPSGSGANPTDDHSAGSFELANMEMWNLLNGRPQLAAGTPPTVSGSSFAGRWGENTSRLDPAVANILGGTVLSAGTDVPGDPFPLPGTSHDPSNPDPTKGVVDPATGLAKNADDNNNHLEGGTFFDAQNVFHAAFVQPADFFAAGTWVTGTQGKQRLLFPGTGIAHAGTVAGSEQFPQYSQFWINCTFPALNPAQWAQFFLGALNGPGNFTGKLMADLSGNPSGGVKTLVDEPDETWTEPSAAAQQPDDNIFGASENAIQLSGGDYSALGNPGRTASLMPFNFVSNARAALIRQRFTSTSWDLKSFGKEFFGAYDGTTNDVRRLWEFTDTSGPPATGAGPFRFPPNFGPIGSAIAPSPPPYTAATTYPLRLALANLLQTLANPKQTSSTFTGVVLPQRLMSVNGLTEQYQNGTDSSGNPIYTFRFRPLTPHPSTAATNFANSPITPFPPAGASKTLPSVPWIAEPEQLGNAATPPSQAYMQQQEWLARYDRQRMARDVYTLLYLMGGGSDALNYASNGATSINNEPVSGVRPLYTDDQLQEMAQFAVNLVDALDPDSNITVFEYDKNLADGWNLDDNAYDGSDAIIAGDRGVVYGVERQQLCLNEAMITYAQKCMNTQLAPVPAKHPDTQWDDRNAAWSFLYMELENVGPAPVNFQNEQWQIAVKQSPIMTAPSAYYGTGTGTSGEMRLIFTSTQPNVAAGVNTGGTSSRLTIGGMIGSASGAAGSFTVLNNTNPTTATPHPSYMVIDPNDLTGTPTNTGFDAQFPIAPRAAYVSPLAAPFANTNVLNPSFGGLDLVDPAQNTNYWVVPPNTTTPTADGAPVPNTPVSAGSQLLQFNDPTAQILPSTAPVVLRIELRRRADLNRSAILPSDPNQINEAADNPWIVVDYMDVPVSVLALKITGNANDFAPQIQYQLGHLTAPPAGSYYTYSPVGGGAPNVSTERSQPLYHDYALNPFNPLSTNAATPNGPFTATAATAYPRNGGATTLTAPLWQGNSLGQDNDAADNDSNITTPIPPHPLYQPHYDRDFTSVGELFNIPLYGPYGPASPTTLSSSTPLSAGNGAALSSGLTHLMIARVTEAGVPTAVPTPTSPTPELLVGADYVPTDTTITPKQHYAGYGTAGFRIQHPEGSDQTNPNPASDFTENRWYRLLGFVEVPTRSHRGIDEPNGIGAYGSFAPYQIAAGSINGSLGFYRTPGKININTLRYPDIVAGLVGEPDIFNMGFTAALPPGQNLPAGLSVPNLLQSVDPSDTVAVLPPQNPTSGTNVRDWWEQFIATRDGVDPLPTANGGTGLSIPGMPKSPAGAATSFPGFPANYPIGSHPFRGMGFSAYGGVDANGYNGALESNLIRSLSGDAVTTGAGTFDLRRRLFELGTNGEHTASTWDYATKQRLLSRLIGNTTTRSNVFFVWIQVDFFQAKDVGPSLTPPDSGVVRVGAKLGSPGVPGTSPAYRGFFVIDRSQALPLVTSQSLPATVTGQPFVFSFNQSFNYQSLILYQQRIQ